MAQPAPAPMITPSATIKIKNATPDQDSVTIDVGQEVEMHNEDNVPYEIPFSYESGGNTYEYPLAVLLPAGGKLDLIGLTDATCGYDVGASPAASGAQGHRVLSAPYNIIVGSGVPGSKSEKK